MVVNLVRDKKIIKLGNQFKNVIHPSFSTLLENTVERVLAIDQLNEKYAEIPLCINARDFMNNVLKALHVSYELKENALASIPKEGPLIVICNHPFGALEGILLSSLLGSIRTDFKFLGNYLLEHIPELDELIISVNPFKGERSTKMNIRPTIEAIKWVRDGGVLIIFPAGEVSNIDVRHFQIVDPEWSTSIPRIIRNTGASVLPVFFLGTNGPVFHIAGLVHPLLRTVMLPRELLNKSNKCIKISIGSLIPYKKLRTFEKNEDMIDYLRLRTYLLKNRFKNSKYKNKITSYSTKIKSYEPVAERQDVQKMVKEISELNPEDILIEKNEYLVCMAMACQIPHILQEIGRLRELTFRNFYEGTGKSLDNDYFDQYYLHLFVWNKYRNEIVGAYRLGMADVIIESGLGIKGLYTNTLFKYQKNLLEKINPALELGRSFVSMDYQRNYSPLLLLWQGIGRFISRNPQYKILFGPVSINKDYTTISRRLIVDFLRKNNYLPDLAKMVRARRPFKKTCGKLFHSLAGKECIKDIDDISTLISDIEEDQKGIPVLLKQYLKLGGYILGFNIDPAFDNVLDALLLVDLTHTDRKLLERYMGYEEAETFLAYHNRLTTSNDTIKTVTSPRTCEMVNTHYL